MLREAAHDPIGAGLLARAELAAEPSGDPEAAAALALYEQDPEAAFERLLEAVTGASGDRRDRLRAVTVGLFGERGADDPLTVALPPPPGDRALLARFPATAQDGGSAPREAGRLSRATSSRTRSRIETDADARRGRDHRQVAEAALVHDRRGLVARRHGRDRDGVGRQPLRHPAPVRVAARAADGPQQSRSVTTPVRRSPRPSRAPSRRQPAACASRSVPRDRVALREVARIWSDGRRARAEVVSRSQVSVRRHLRRRRVERARVARPRPVPPPSPA